MEAGSEMIAEGVETKEELAMVRQLGVRLVQGYIVAQPAPADHWTIKPGKAAADPAYRSLPRPEIPLEW